MRSRWSAERAIALLAASSLEAAWLMLAYAAMQWLTGDEVLHLDIAEFAIGVGAGLALARTLRRWRGAWFAASLVGVAVVAGVVGVWLAVAPGLSSTEMGRALDVNPGGWLLGIAVLRGTAHGDPDDEGRLAAALMTRGLVGLVAFWLFATVSGLAKVEDLAATSFAASLTLVSAGLLAMGLARLADLDVEAIDREARRRWLTLLLGVSGALLVLGLPLASLIGLPVATALAGIAGPLGPILVALVTLIGAPFVLLLSALTGLLDGLRGRASPPPVPSQAVPSGFAHGAYVPNGGLDLTWLLWLTIAAVVALLLVAIGLLLRRPPPESSPDETTGELREAEPFTVGAGFHLPRLRSRRPPRGTPGSAVEAYRFALLALAGRAEGRESRETPREHARRVAQAPLGSDLGRLAVDYELAALGGRTITSAEERRAFARWRRILRSAK